MPQSDEPTNVYITALNDQGVDRNDQDTNEGKYLSSIFSKLLIMNLQMVQILTMSKRSWRCTHKRKSRTSA